MPMATKEEQKEYQRSWIAQRRAEWFSDKECIDCDGTEKLELDHLDPTQKVHHAIWSWSKERRDAETAKCVVRCNRCHIKRHADERRIDHPCGTVGRYKKGCHCDLCRGAKAAQMREWRSRKRQESAASLA